MSYRDTAVAVARDAPGNFVGVMYSVALPYANLPARWNVVALASADALEEWYDEIAGAPTLYYYLAAFDKTRGMLPVGESIAPPKPGEPGFSVSSTWRHPPFVRARPAISGATATAPGGGLAAVGVAVGAVFATALLLAWRS